MSPFYRPFLEELPSRILPSAGPLSAALLPLVEPPMSDCVEMRTMEQSHRSMEILMSPAHCCSSELVVHIENGNLVLHLPPTLAGRIVWIEGRDIAVLVGDDGHAHIPFTDAAGTVTLTVTNHEGEHIPFLRVTHDGHGTVTKMECLTDLHTLMKEEHEVHLPHAMHEEHLPHPLHEEHVEHPHAPHVPHMEHVEEHENHVPHIAHEEKEHKEPSPLEEHEPTEGDRVHQERNRSMDQQQRDDRALFEEAFDWGSWWEEEPLTIPLALENDGTPSEQQESIPPSESPDLWPIMGSATVAAAALAGAYALERRARQTAHT